LAVAVLEEEFFERFSRYQPRADQRVAQGNDLENRAVCRNMEYLAGFFVIEKADFQQ